MWQKSAQVAALNQPKLLLQQALECLFPQDCGCATMWMCDNLTDGIAGIVSKIHMTMVHMSTPDEVWMELSGLRIA